MRILHLTSSFQPGGMETLALRLAAAQAGQGHATWAAAPRHGPLQHESLSKGTRTLIFGGRSAPLRAARLALIARRVRPTIIHVHNPSTLQYGALAKRLTGSGLVMTDHNQGRGVARRPTAREQRLTDALVCVSGYTAGKIDSYGWKGVAPVVIYNGVAARPPPRSRNMVRADLDLGAGPVAIVVATLDAVKAHEVLLRALSLLRPCGPPLTLLVAGAGPLRAQLEHEACELRVDDRVRLLGRRSDVPDLLGAADLFVLPSRNEGLPMSILEAMAAGLPVVATAVGGVPELVVDGETGILVPPGDLEALAGAMAKLAGSPELRRRMGCAGRARVEAHFTLDGMAAQYEALYREALARPARR